MDPMGTKNERKKRICGSIDTRILTQPEEFVHGLVTGHVGVKHWEVTTRSITSIDWKIVILWDSTGKNGDLMRFNGI